MEILPILSLLPFFFLSWVFVRKFHQIITWPEALTKIILFGLVFILIAVGIIGQLIKNFDNSFFVGSILCLLFGLVLHFTIPKNKTSLKDFRIKSTDWPLLLLLAFSTLTVIIVTIRYAIHDEIRLQGHISLIQMMLAGKFPPTLIAFPDVSLRYHYGFNLLAAVFAKAFYFSASGGIDVVTILTWVLLCTYLLIFFRDQQIPRKGWGLAFAVVVLTGGLSWWIAQHDLSADAIFQLYNWQQMFVASRAIHPSFILYFFQHPMGLGVVFFLAIIHYFSCWLETPRFRGLVPMAVLLGALSLVQVMLFITLLFCLGIVFLIRVVSSASKRIQEVGWGLSLLVFVIIITVALGGFFSFSKSGDSQIHLTWPVGYLQNEYYGGSHPIGWSGMLYWYLSGFGLFIFLIPFGFYYGLKSRNQTRLLLAIFCGVSFIIPQLFQYRFSWDIVKWFFGFEFSGKLLLCAVFIPIIIRKQRLLTVVWILVLLSMVTPMRFLSELSFRKSSSFSRAESRIAGYRPLSPGPGLSAVVKEMAECKECYGMVWSSAETSPTLAMLTGFPMVQIDNNTSSMLGDINRWRQRQEELHHLEQAPTEEMLNTLGIRWVIYQCGEVTRLPPSVQQFLGEIKQSSHYQDKSVREGQECFVVFERKI